MGLTPFGGRGVRAVSKTEPLPQENYIIVTLEREKKTRSREVVKSKWENAHKVLRIVLGRW